jgi:hypothetical protein
MTRALPLNRGWDHGPSFRQATFTPAGTGIRMPPQPYAAWRGTVVPASGKSRSRQPETASGCHPNLMQPGMGPWSQLLVSHVHASRKRHPGAPHQPNAAGNGTVVPASVKSRSCQPKTASGCHPNLMQPGVGPWSQLPVSHVHASRKRHPGATSTECGREWDRGPNLRIGILPVKQFIVAKASETG